MYLANDVIQNSRKKGPEFSKEFGAVLKASFEVVAKYSTLRDICLLLFTEFFNKFRDSDEKTLASLERILTIWESRAIYEANQISSFKTSLALRKNLKAVKQENNGEQNNSDVKPKDKAPEKSKDKDKHKREHKSSKESKESKSNDKSSKESKESKKRSHENSKESQSEKKRATADAPISKSSSLIQNNGKSKTLTKAIERLDKKPTPIIPLVSAGTAVDPETLIKALQDLENSASADASVRQKIASLPTEVFDATLLDKIRDKGAAERLTKLVDEARSLLADYNSRLAQELEERKHISNILSNFTQNQRVALSAAEQKLTEYKEKLRKVVHVRNELKSHLQNLPDLSRLPSVTGLAPLPSACDLFNVARINNSTEHLSVFSSVSPNESNASPADTGTPGSNTSL